MAYVAPTFVNEEAPPINASNLNNLVQAVEKLGVENGGTGQTTLYSGAIITGNGTSPVGNLHGVGAVYASADGSPQFGVLPRQFGGTGVTTMSALRDALYVFKIQVSAPSDTNVLWINPTNSTLSYYYNDAWHKILGVFGS